MPLDRTTPLIHSSHREAIESRAAKSIMALTPGISLPPSLIKSFPIIAGENRARTGKRGFDVDDDDST